MPVISFKITIWEQRFLGTAVPDDLYQTVHVFQVKCEEQCSFCKSCRFWSYYIIFSFHICVKNTAIDMLSATAVIFNIGIWNGTVRHACWRADQALERPTRLAHCESCSLSFVARRWDETELEETEVAAPHLRCLWLCILMASWFALDLFLVSSRWCAFCYGAWESKAAAQWLEQFTER